MRSFKLNCLKQILPLIMVLFSAGFIQAQGRELANGKFTTQSSNYTPTDGLSSKAVDGNTSGKWADRSVTHTNGNGESNPWWEVDLGELCDIGSIEIWNRTDCCMDRLNNVRIVIKKNAGDAGDLFLGSDHQYRSGETYPLKFNNNKQGRYVRIQLINPKGILSLAEVKVYGLPAGGPNGTAFYFDGRKSVDIPADPHVNLQGEGTVEFSVAATWANAPAYNPCILAVRDTRQTLYSFHIRSDRKAIAFWNGKVARFLPYDFSDGGGYHVAIVTKGNSTTVYVEGESIGTMDMGYNGVTGLPLHIGTSDGTSEAFIGGITGVRIFNRALPQSTIREYMRTIIAIGATHPYFNNLMGYSKYNASKSDYQFLLTNNSITPAPPTTIFNIVGIWSTPNPDLFLETSRTPTGLQVKESKTPGGVALPGRIFTYDQAPDEPNKYIRKASGSYYTFISDNRFEFRRADGSNLTVYNRYTPAPTPPQLLSPSANSTVPNNCNNTKIKWNFDWTDVPNATEYQIYVAHQGSNPVINNVTTANSNYTYERAGSTVIDRLLDNWYVKVRAKVNGTWTNWTAHQPFKVAACPKPTTIKFSNSSIYAVSYEVTIKHSDPNILPSVQGVDIGIAGASKSITVPGDATVSVKGSALKIATWTSVFNLGYGSYGSGKTWCFDIVTGLGTLGYTRKTCQ